MRSLCNNLFNCDIKNLIYKLKQYIKTWWCLVCTKIAEFNLMLLVFISLFIQGCLMYLLFYLVPLNIEIPTLFFYIEECTFNILIGISGCLNNWLILTLCMPLYYFYYREQKNISSSYTELNKFKIKYRDNLIYEDVIKTVNSYICANRVKYVDKKLFNRRVRNDSIMTSCKTKNNIVAHHMCANELYDLYINKEKDLDNRSKLNFIKCIEEFYMKATEDSYILNEYDCIKNIKISIKKNKKVNGIFLDMLINKPILWALVKRN